LSHLWTFDSDDGTPGNDAYRGQGNHGIAVGDVDADERDEIVYGSCIIDDDGTGLYSTGYGHGDSMHFTDIDPRRPGLEVFKANGDGPNRSGIQLRDARTGEEIFGVPSRLSGGMGRAVAFDVDPRHSGLEMWGYDTLRRSRSGWWWTRRHFHSNQTQPAGAAYGDSLRPSTATSAARRASATGLYDVHGNRISNAMPGPCNMGIWWDGDLLRELLDGVRVTKWDFQNERDVELFDAAAFDCVSNNGSKSNPCLCADILGDWREEIIARSRDNRELRVFCTTVPTDFRFATLMHDPVYRLAVAWQNVSYNQSAHPGFFLGNEMAEPPVAKITTVAPASEPNRGR
jgi:rhamnogalacturonan endolyase